MVKPNFCFYSGLIFIDKLQKKAIAAKREGKQISGDEVVEVVNDYCAYASRKDYLRREHLVQEVIDGKDCMTSI